VAGGESPPHCCLNHVFFDLAIAQVNRAAGKRSHVSFVRDEHDRIAGLM
jgi:hypothetical protein